MILKDALGRQERGTGDHLDSRPTSRQRCLAGRPAAFLHPKLMMMVGGGAGAEIDMLQSLCWPSERASRCQVACRQGLHAGPVSSPVRPDEFFLEELGSKLEFRQGQGCRWEAVWPVWRGNSSTYSLSLRPRPSVWSAIRAGLCLIIC